MTTTELRESLARFANYQEGILRKNDFKSGWDKESITYLKGRLEEEFVELLEALGKEDLEAIRIECADVSNICMMVFDNSFKGK